MPDRRNVPAGRPQPQPPMRVFCRPVPLGPITAPPPYRVDVWRFAIADLADRDAEWSAAVSDTERARAARYTLARTRDQFVRARGMLRTILGGCLGCEASAVRLVTRSGGKPELADGELHFNLSHAAEVGLIAVARRPVGIDVEPLRDVANADGLVARFFAPEEQTAFAALPSELRRVGFFRGWTGKEALLKAVGRGILELDRCVVELDPRRPAEVLAFDEPGWKLMSWEPWPGVAAAVAVRSDEELELTVEA